MQWTKAPADASLCTVITTTYEIDEDENDDGSVNDADDDDGDDMEQGVHQREVVPGPRVSFFVRLFSGTHEADASVTIDTHRDGDSHKVPQLTGIASDVQTDTSDDGFKAPPRKRTVSDFTADTSVASDVSSVPKAGSVRASSFRLDPAMAIGDIAVATDTIPEASERTEDPHHDDADDETSIEADGTRN